MWFDALKFKIHYLETQVRKPQILALNGIVNRKNKDLDLPPFFTSAIEIELAYALMQQKIWIKNPEFIKDLSDYLAELCQCKYKIINDFVIEVIKDFEEFLPKLNRDYDLGKCQEYLLAVFAGLEWEAYWETHAIVYSSKRLTMYQNIETLNQKSFLTNDEAILFEVFQQISLLKQKEPWIAHRLRLYFHMLATFDMEPQLLDSRCFGLYGFLLGMKFSPNSMNRINDSIAKHWPSCEPNFKNLISTLQKSGLIYETGGQRTKGSHYCLTDLALEIIAPKFIDDEGLSNAENLADWPDKIQYAYLKRCTLATKTMDEIYHFAQVLKQESLKFLLNTVFKDQKLDTEIRPLVKHLLSSNNSWKRAVVCQALRYAQKSLSLPLLVETSERDQSVHVQENAIASMYFLQTV